MKTDRRLIMQIGKHNLNLIPGLRILMALDVWEHAYCLDYKSDRAKFIESFRNIVSGGEVNKRFGSHEKKVKARNPCQIAEIRSIQFIFYVDTDGSEIAHFFLCGEAPD